MTLPVSDDSLNTRLCLATLRDVFNASRHGSGPQKPLNGISFPNPYAAVVETPEASDFRAVRRTGHCVGCTDRIPNHLIRFSLAGTEGAFHYIHLDPRGNATWIRVACGLKWWFVIRMRDGRQQGSTTFWTVQDLDIRKINLDECIVEVMVLRPKDKL